MRFLPGQRLLVEFDEDPGYSHERLLLWPVFSDEEEWIVLTPHWDRYLERRCDWSSVFLMNGRRVFPDSAQPEVIHFEAVVDDEAFAEEVGAARLEARTEQVSLPGRVAAAEPATGLTWDGGTRELPSSGIGDAIRRRLRGKRPVAAPPATSLDHGTPPATPERGADTPVGSGLMLPEAESPNRALVPKPGHTWVVSTIGARRYSVGQEIRLGEQSMVFGEHALHIDDSAECVACELVAIADLRDFIDRKRAGLERAEPERPPVVDLRARLSAGDGPKVVGCQTEPYDEDDSRTLYVDTDSHELRWKPWREVVYESYNVPLVSWDQDGGQSALDFCRYIERQHGDPRRWFTSFKRDKWLEENDRVCHEMKVLVDVLHYCQFDQLNLGGLATYELVCRRLQAIINAYKVPGKANWSTAKLFSGGIGIDDGIQPSLRAHVARKAREMRELENLGHSTASRGEWATEVEGEVAGDAPAGPGVSKGGRGAAAKRRAGKNGAAAAAK